MAWTLGPRVCQWWPMEHGKPTQQDYSTQVPYSHLHCKLTILRQEERKSSSSSKPTDKKTLVSHTHTHQDARRGKTHTHTDLRSSSPVTERCEHSLIHADTRQHTRYSESTPWILWHFPCKQLVAQRNKLNFTACNCVLPSCSG